MKRQHDKDIDLSTKSEPWTEQELSDFRKIMQEIKAQMLNVKKRLCGLIARNNPYNKPLITTPKNIAQEALTFYE